MCQSASAAGVPVSHHTGLTQQYLCAYDYCYYFHSSHHFLMIVCCCLSQLCIESCPNRHLTLLKAKTNKEDLEYYSQFCKEGVDIRKLVSDQMIWSFTSYTCLDVYCDNTVQYVECIFSKNPLKAVSCDSECSWDPEGRLVSCDDHAQ